jgi:hypothetical protein
MICVMRGRPVASWIGWCREQGEEYRVDLNHQGITVRVRRAAVGIRVTV